MELTMARVLTLIDDEGAEEQLPLKWEICGCCEGRGKSSAYLGAFTREDMDEEGPEFMEDYMAGHYDRACDDCGGSGKVQVVDYDKLTADQKKQYDDAVDEEASYQRMCAAERAMGA
jgi:excinuclease UvrABC ATPase subunit